MVGHVVVEAHREVVGERFERATAHGGQEFLQVVHALVEPLDDRIDLGPEAGGQDDHLGEVGPVAQAAQRLGQLGLGHRHPFQQVERRVALLETDDDHRHGRTPVVPL